MMLPAVLGLNAARIWRGPQRAARRGADGHGAEPASAGRALEAECVTVALAPRTLHGGEGGGWMARVRGNRALQVLLASAGAPPETQDERGLVLVLAAFHAAGHDAARGPVAARSDVAAPSRRMATGRSATALGVVFALAVAGAAAAAHAGALPAPIQRLVHEVFGGARGAPGTATRAAEGTASVSADAPLVVGAVASASPSPDVWSTAALAGLCGTVLRGGDSRGQMSVGGRAALVAAAGGEHKIPSYCARVVPGPRPPATASPLGAASAPLSPGAAALRNGARPTLARTLAPASHLTSH